MIENYEKFEKIKGQGLILLLSNIYIDPDGLYLFVYHAFKEGHYKKIGRITVRPGESSNTKYMGNIGYAISKKHRGNGYAALCCTLIFQILKENEVKEVFITTNINNIPSIKTCEKLQGHKIGVVDPPKGLKGEGRKFVYKFTL